MEYEEYLAHYGVLGMKWGIRKKRKFSSNKNAKNKSSSKSNLKSKAKAVISKVDKQKVKNIAKTSARIGARILAVSLLGYAGSVAYSEIDRLTKLNWEKDSTIKDLTNEYNKAAVTNNNNLMSLIEERRKNKAYADTIKMSKLTRTKPEDILSRDIDRARRNGNEFEANFYEELLKNLDL